MRHPEIPRHGSSRSAWTPGARRPISDEVDLSKYKSVDLWCVQFAVSFGAAQLTSRGQ
ncbi:DM13 domain-containing protein [Arthrobacter sp. ES3-54]|uniref:DM13 domain-containing protein n=1 Tax=Arthrobacter sp. ES3-54 TaxID=1502991 RepID=UPI0032176D80